MKGLGWGTGLTVKTGTQGSVGSEARKPWRLQTVLEREESAIQVGFWGRNGAAPRNSRGTAGSQVPLTGERDSGDISSCPWMRTRVAFLPATSNGGSTLAGRAFAGSA